MNLRNTDTGETAPAHVLGTDTKGATLVRYVDGWEPDDFRAELDEDGYHVVPETPAKSYSVTAPAGVFVPLAVMIHDGQAPRMRHR